MGKYKAAGSYPGPEIVAHVPVMVQDHKAVGEGDTGPNTGGMGAYSPAPAVTAQIQEQVMQQIVQRTADALVAEGCPYRGVLFAGLMIKDGKVVTGIVVQMYQCTSILLTSSKPKGTRHHVG